MLRNLSNLTGFSVAAKDGPIGSVQDFYFDDTFWKLRYVVIDLGSWLSGKEVLLSPSTLTTVGMSSMATDLSKENIKNSPDIDSDKPITRHFEEELHNYYAWPYYWDYDSSRHPDRSRENQGPHESIREAPGEQLKDDIPSPESSQMHLQSFKDIVGFHIDAEDGTIGHLDDFIFDDEAWVMRYAVFATRNWLPGKHVLFMLNKINRIDWNQNRLLVNATRNQIFHAPHYSQSEPFSKEFELQIHHYFDSKPYWI